MARFSDLPERVFGEIISWLPPESLIQFKLIQKSWYLRINALINNTEFVAKHLCNTKKRRMLSTSCRVGFVLMGEQEIPKRETEEAGCGKDDGNGNVGQLLVLANDDHSDCDFIPCNTNLLRELKHRLDNDSRNSLESQCNGIICFSFNDTVCLLNPALRELKIVHIPCHIYKSNFVLAVGFGYDSRAEEYKVFVIHLLIANGEALTKARVYSLRTNSWRDIKCDIEVPLGEDQVVYCNGVCYWFHTDSEWKMFCFDFSDEVFRDVPLPDWNHPVEGWLVLSKLSVRNESVVLLLYPDYEEYEMTIDVWTLDSEGGSYSWTKQLRIGQLEGIKRPLGFWNDAKLILEAEDGEMKLYDLGSGTVSRISTGLDWFRADRFVIYEKSLVSVLRKEGRRSVIEQL